MPPHFSTHNWEDALLSQRQPSDRELDRLECMLERCIEADKKARKKRRAQLRELKVHSQENFKLLVERQKEWLEEQRKQFGREDEQS